MLTATTKSLRATVITTRTVREAVKDESASENEENLVLEALTIRRSGLVGGVLAIRGRTASKEGGGLVLGVIGDLILGVNGDLDLEQGPGDTIAEVGVITEAFQGVGQYHPVDLDREKCGEPGIATRMSPSKNEITRCWTTSRSKTNCYPAQRSQPLKKKRTTYLLLASPRRKP